MVRKFIFSILILLILPACLTSIVYAEVWFTSQPKIVYNIGDGLEISASVSEVGEQLEASVVCGNESKFIFLKYIESESSAEISQLLSSSFLGEFIGECKVVAKYGQDIAESSIFKISNEVFLRVTTEKFDYSPGEEVIIKGDAEKANTKLLNGFFELSFGEISVAGAVENGKFETNFTLLENAAAGRGAINFVVYEKEKEEKTNKGEKNIEINIKQIPNKIDVALNSQNIKPGNNLNFKILLYDQSENTMYGDASYLIENLDGSPFVKSLAKIEEDRSFFVEKNFSSGYYKIKAYASGAYGERQFYIEENEEAEFKVEAGTLTIKNVGNVNYNKAVQIKIGGNVEIINDELEIGEEKSYKLMAPDGTYSIMVTDGSNSLSGEGVSLTGNIVSVREIQKSFFGRNKIVVWAFIILVLGMFVFVSSRRVLKKRFVLSEPFFGKTDGGKSVFKSGEPEILKEIREAEHTLVLKGQKQDTAIICLKIKNELSNEAKINLEKILGVAYENKGAVYKTGGNALLIFSPLITKTFRNHVSAVRIAANIARNLQDYNSKFKDKIDFGISVHSGDIVNRIEENKLKFTSLGNTLTLAKRIAELSRGEVLLSKELHVKTMNEVKADKIERQGFEVFTIKRVADTERNEKFIRDFLNRQGTK